MTVRELIERLNAMPPDSVVMVTEEYDGKYDEWPLTCVNEAGKRVELA